MHRPRAGGCSPLRESQQSQHPFLDGRRHKCRRSKRPFASTAPLTHCTICALCALSFSLIEINSILFYIYIYISIFLPCPPPAELAEGLTTEGLSPQQAGALFAWSLELLSLYSRHNLVRSGRRNILRNFFRNILEYSLGLLPIRARFRGGAAGGGCMRLLCTLHPLRCARCASVLE